MTNNGVNVVVRVALLTLVVGVAETAVAMPTEHGLKKVRPLVQGQMEPDVGAIKQADVAKSAMDIYAKGDSSAVGVLRQGDHRG